MDELEDEKLRAEDILLGSLGYGEGAKIISVRLVACGYEGEGEFADGEKFQFKYEEEPDDLEKWALEVMKIAMAS